MLQKWNKKKIFIVLIIIGSLWRILLFISSPPTNSFDDHLEVVAIYADNFERPQPAECWQCYQPPAYYTLAAITLNLSKLVLEDNYWSWKVVQIINPVLSILILFVFYNIIDLLKLTNLQKILYLSFIVLLPREMFTATMIGNDYLLLFSSVTAFYFYLKSLKDVHIEGRAIKNFALLSFFVCLGGITKQHGIILVALPIYPLYLSWKNNNQKALSYLTLYLLVCSVVFSEELWKFLLTGEWLVSNQQFFNYADGQFPGSLNRVEFYSFRIFELFEHPFISEKTAASFPTEIFARIFFDYEWRFLVPEIPKNIWVGRFAYFLGLNWLSYFILSSLISLKRIGRLSISKFNYGIIIPAVVYGLFFLVPIVQTFRYPYYSSMKAMFILPGIVVLIAIHGRLIRQLKLSNAFIYILVAVNIVYGTLLVISVYSYLDISLDHLHGPLWPLPE